ncbi:hypothetical protein R6G99_10475, partial [Actinotignum timonense]|nr:hypothetical protein [Actinotignum timonense]
NIIGTMDMEQALTGRDRINDQLRSVDRRIPGNMRRRAPCLPLRSARDLRTAGVIPPCLTEVRQHILTE